MKVVIHCSASPHGRGDNAETIHRWHLERGWAGIGYHYVITEDGTLEHGRPEYWAGAHVKGNNLGSVGICLIGDDHFTPEQFDALDDLLDDILTRHEGVEIYGHYQLDSGKTCPNFDVPEWLEGRGLISD